MNEKVTSIPELFGSMVFTQEQMRQRLPTTSTMLGSSAWCRERHWTAPSPTRSPPP